MKQECPGRAVTHPGGELETGSTLFLAPAEMGKECREVFPSLFTQVSTEPTPAHDGDRVGAASLSAASWIPQSRGETMTKDAHKWTIMDSNEGRTI